VRVAPESDRQIAHAIAQLIRGERARRGGLPTRGIGAARHVHVGSLGDWSCCGYPGRRASRSRVVGGFVEDGSDESRPTRSPQSGRHHYRLFCLLDYEAKGVDKPLLVVIDGRDKPFRTTLSDPDYAAVRRMGDQYRDRNPRSLA